MIRNLLGWTVLAVILFFCSACQPNGQNPITEPVIQGTTDARSATGLAYDLAGEGPLVVLIHGTNLDRRMWRAEVSWLQEHAKVLSYDLRGQGASSFPTEAYSNHRDLLNLLDELGESTATLVGLSAGAQVALDVALTAPQRVHSLILVSPSLLGYTPKEMPPFFADLMGALKARDFKQANEVLLASSIMAVPSEQEDHVRTMVEENERLWTIPYSLVEALSPPAFGRLQTVNSPTLVLVGETDLPAVQEQSLLLEQKIPDAQRMVISAGGHLLNMTSPLAFREAVSTFLRASAH